MHSERLTALAEIIEKTDYEPDTFTMESWLEMEHPEQFRPIADLDDLDEIVAITAECGTRACIAGYAVMLFDETDAWQERFPLETPNDAVPSIRQLAAQLLDLTQEQADLLFLPQEDPDPCRQIPPRYQVTPADAANTMYRMTETGEVQWLIERCPCCGDAANTYDCSCTVGECDCANTEPDAAAGCPEGPDCACRHRSD